MKKFLIILVSSLSLGLFSQTPQKINYQGVARDASGNIISSPIGLKFEIFQGSPGGTLVYEETNNQTPSSVGIFTAAIGGGTVVSGNFSLINWAAGPYFITVSMDPLGGTSYSTMGTSELLSVPYALYAENAGNTQTVNITGPNVIGAYPNYTILAPGALTASTGISITGGTITNTAPDQPVSIVGLGSATVSGTYPNFVISTPSTATATPSSTLSINPPHSITTLGPNNYSISIQPTNISGSNVLGSYPNYTILAGSPPNIIGTGVTTVTSAANSYTVNTPPVNMTFLPGNGTLSYSPAIGPNTLNITPNVTFTNNILTVGSNTVSIPGTGVWTRPTTTAATLINANDFVGIGITSPPNRLYVLESNPTIAVVAKNTHTTTSNANAMGLWGESNNAHGTSAGVYGVHNGGGNGVTGISSTTSYTSTAGVYGYAAGSATSNVSIQADVAIGNSTGIFVNSFAGHNGTGLYSLKAGSAGNAGKFEISNAANPADAMFATTTGTGAAVRAVSGGGTISALSVHLDNGHIKSSSTAAPTQFSVTVAGGFTTPGFAPTCIGTDVKGVISFSTSATGLLAVNSLDIQYNFQKPYSVAPTVLLTPTTDIKGLSFMVLSSSTTNFVVRIFRPNGATFPPSIAAGTFFNFNYFIIE